jgi:galactose mutarotase-like enzyme
VLGYDTFDEYVMGRNPSFGSVPGRVANRIQHGVFTVGDETYEVEKNNGEHHLHGGSQGNLLSSQGNLISSQGNLISSQGDQPIRS